MASRSDTDLVGASINSSRCKTGCPSTMTSLSIQIKTMCARRSVELVLPAARIASPTDRTSARDPARHPCLASPI